MAEKKIMTYIKLQVPAGAASPTRGVIFQGYSSPSNQAVLDFFTTASTGNALDFGDPTNPSTSMGLSLIHI